MTIIYNGVDLVEIDRFENLNQAIKERFFRRVFTQKERDEANRSLQRLAGKFAAKEASAKALGCGIGIISWQELEILENPQGKPELFLHGNAVQVAKKAGWKSWSVSISHTRTLAIAVVTAFGNDISTP
ncbi:MAG TPA: holo-ACP synthase [Dehalococcoidales bacterium]|nr:holo-ACP synthase [Dehalococcoidales bacterium]